MYIWILFAVVITTAIFLYILIKLKQKEIRSTQVLLLQFIDQFEEQYQDIVSKFEAYKQSLDAKYDELYHFINYKKNGTFNLNQQVETSEVNNQDERESDVDPLQIKDRYRSVLQLQQEGKTIDEIARSTGKGKGEIQLILELLEK